jgi:hypothetical protein
MSKASDQIRFADGQKLEGFATGNNTSKICMRIII